MKIKKVMLAGLFVIMMSFALTACSNEKKDASEGETGQRTEEAEATEETEASEETETTEETGTTEEIDGLSESSLNGEMADEAEASAEFEIPIQEDFIPAAGLSSNYADFDNRAFAYNGTVFTLGDSTLKDLIDGGIPFDESDLNNKGNNVNSNYQTSTYTARINDYATMQFTFVNTTGDTRTEEECLLSNVRYFYLYVPQPDYDAELNAKIKDNILDAAKAVCFSFPATLTKEQLLENNSNYTELTESNCVNYYIDSEVYMGSSGYHFEFNDTTNQLEQVSISWLP